MALSRFWMMTVAGIAVATAPSARAAESIFGRWMTDDRSAIVRIDRCGGKLCGTIERVLNARAPTNDINNPDPAHHKRPLVGTMVLTGFSGSGTAWDGGRAYDPKAGKSYRSRLKLEGDSRLQVTGCVMFLCRSMIWTRAN